MPRLTAESIDDLMVGHMDDGLLMTRPAGLEDLTAVLKAMDDETVTKVLDGIAEMELIAEETFDITLSTEQLLEVVQEHGEAPIWYCNLHKEPAVYLVGEPMAWCSQSVKAEPIACAVKRALVVAVQE